MEKMEQPEKKGFFYSNTVKMVLVGALTLVLLIPLALVKDLINERFERQNEVVLETTKKWGENVYFYGPIIKVPYKEYTESISVDEKTKVATTRRTVHIEYAYFFPETLDNLSDVKTKVLKRSNYESAVFTSDMKFNENYIRPDFTQKNIADTDIQWD